MNSRQRLWFGPLAAALLVAVLVLLPFLVPGYDSVRQTVSEIGEAGSPARWPFTAALLLVALCLLVFASGVWDAASERKRGFVGAILIAAMAVSVAGVGWFAYPHPLHNTFGESELIGYLAPLAFAIAWRGEPIGRVSLLGFVLLWASIAANLGYLGLLGGDAENALAPLQPFYGLVQRSLFLIWFAWCAAVGLLLLRRPA